MPRRYRDRTLDQLLDRSRRTGPLPLKLVLEWTAQLCDLLVARQERGDPPHGAISPETVAVDRRGRVLLREPTDGPPLPEYRAPEQFTDGRPGPGTDLYAVGCLLYALCCGRPPHTGTADEVRQGHLAQEPEPLWHHAPLVPFDVERLVRLLLEGSAAGRAETDPADVATVLRMRAGLPLPPDGLRPERRRSSAVHVVAGISPPSHLWRRRDRQPGREAHQEAGRWPAQPTGPLDVMRWHWLLAVLLATAVSSAALVGWSGLASDARAGTVWVLTALLLTSLLARGVTAVSFRPGGLTSLLVSAPLLLTQALLFELMPDTFRYDYFVSLAEDPRMTPVMGAVLAVLVLAQVGAMWLVQRPLRWLRVPRALRIWCAASCLAIGLLSAAVPGAGASGPGGVLPTIIVGAVGFAVQGVVVWLATVRFRLGLLG